MKYLAMLEQLKDLTLSSKEDLSIPCKYFFTDIIDETSFLQNNKILEKNNEFYEELLRQSVVKYFGHHTQLSVLLLMHLPNTSFIHGGGHLSNGKMLMFYYFQDIQLGMAVVSAFASTTEFFRLTVFSSDVRKFSEKTIIPSNISVTYN